MRFRGVEVHADARTVVCASGEGVFDMVAMAEIAFLLVCVVLVVWWFRRTNMYRARRRSGADPGQAARESQQKHPPKGGYWA